MGHARAGLSEKRWHEIVESIEDAGFELPKDTDTYDLDDVPGYQDGDWPEWPDQLMLSWLPKQVISDFGTVEDSTLNGEYLRLDPSNEGAIVAALSAGGWTCVRDDKLVPDASGYGPV